MPNERHRTRGVLQRDRLPAEGDRPIQEAEQEDYGTHIQDQWKWQE